VLLIHVARLGNFTDLSTLVGPSWQSMVISQLVWTSKRRGEDWPALLLRLYQGMTGSDERDVYSCCKCLYMVCEELPHTDSYNLLPTIAPTIYSIVANGDVSTFSFSGYSSCVYHYSRILTSFV
jgi:hypothetical protein